MKITTEVELMPFNVPNYVIVKMPPRPKQEGIHESPKYHLSELSEETLNQLCEEFRAEVFRKSKEPRTDETIR